MYCPVGRRLTSSTAVLLPVIRSRVSTGRPSASLISTRVGPEESVRTERRLVMGFVSKVIFKASDEGLAVSILSVMSADVSADLVAAATASSELVVAGLAAED